MHVGIGIPTRDGALPPGGMLDWARRAEAAGFSSLAVLDRVVFPLHEPLVTLATVAGATDRIRLLASIVISPTRETTLLARHLQHQGTEVRALLSGLITHAEVDRSAAAAETWSLVAFWAKLLNE